MQMAGSILGQPSVAALSVRALVLALALAFLVQGPAEAASAKVVRHGPRSSDGVALTFDDGWGVDSCERISKTLTQMSATATFFINGNHLRADPARWRRILKDFPVGNHTRSHLWLTRVSKQKIGNQLRNNQWIHREVLGRRMTRVFRPPYGAYDDTVRKVAAQRGYKHLVLWSHSSGDSSPAATVSSIIRRTTGAPRGSILLMHCGPSVTARALPAVIRSYQRRGIRLIGLDEMFRLDEYASR